MPDREDLLPSLGSTTPEGENYAEKPLVQFDKQPARPNTCCWGAYVFIFVGAFRFFQILQTDRQQEWRTPQMIDIVFIESEKSNVFFLNSSVLFLRLLTGT